MDTVWGSNPQTDLHIHTLVSDGEMTPSEAVEKANSLGLKNISLTDHDAIGAYTNFPRDPRELAAREGINLIVGTELDSDYRGIEIHVLGYHIDPDNSQLLSYLQHTKDIRKRRIQDLMVKINHKLGSQAIREQDVFSPFRDTYMKPHVIRPLVEGNFFSKYKEAAQWVKKNIPTEITLPKLPTADIIALIKQAGGQAFLAHPGFYSTECSLIMSRFIEEMILKGLDGIEVYYPYYGTNRNFSSRRKVQEVIGSLEDLANKYGLLLSRGSDSHSLEQLARLNKI
jgi:predicted metal-dependent phosphoesterase TrpH